MTRRHIPASIITLFGWIALASLAHSQTQDSARADGKAFGQSQIEKAKTAASTSPDADRIPNFNADATSSLADLAEQPERIEAKARSAARSHTGLQTIDDSVRRRARFTPAEIEQVIARAGAINETPLEYTSGMAIGGEKGTCVPLPPGSGTAGSYFATCNTGTIIEQGSGMCSVTLLAEIEQQPRYHYLCHAISTYGFGGAPSCDIFKADRCQATGSRPGPCLQWGGNREQGRYCVEPGEPYVEMTCSSSVVGETPYLVTSENIVITRRDESQCQSWSDEADCSQISETCTDEAPQTRIVDGVAVTQSCWEWERRYQCVRRSAGNDCSEIEARPDCRFVREDCISEDSPCSTFERVYECPIPGDDGTGTQYVCDGDVYCIDGSCETIERTANDEFKDAATALHAMNEARGQFDPETLTLFKGSRETCSSKVFGVLNCCKGKGFPLIPGVSLLVALGCDREEILLHERDAQGLCAYVGTYCSSKFLGVCTSKRKAYCCFESKLSRILQEQGRKQLPKPWAKAKEEQCAGFTLDEFARLDLSQMDFSEVYAEFTEAARLPDELETSALIQQKISDYYERSGP
tara:strand:+ start:14752 stop:16494 length:1743 start_codon:yes stop_codon:yes gene_type:complete